jgi:hypothetical protein
LTLERIEADLAAIEGDAALEEELNLRLRVRALARLDFVVECSRWPGRSETWRGLGRRAAVQQRRLDRANQRLFERVRSRIRSGDWSPGELRAWLDSVVVPSTRQEDDDALDALFDGVLQLEQVPQRTQPLAPEMIPLEPTPARAILALVDLVPWRPDDVFCDLGSGLGHAVLWVHLLTGVRAIGVEVEPAYCCEARARAEELGLAEVAFVEADARTAELGEGTVFYLFSPFSGEMLQTVLDRLRVEAQRRPIRVCGYGPCTGTLRRQSWLTRMRGDTGQGLAVFVGSIDDRISGVQGRDP